MDTTDSGYLKLDQEFDRYLAEMKPHVLKLPHKTDRQKCAVWIKKLCEPTSGLSGRKNRNMYGQLMLHMLKRGVLEGPFTSKPQDGPLPTLPAYMSIYLEDQTETNQVPDWVNGELTTTAGSSLFRSTIGNPAAHSTWRSPPNSPSRRPHTALGIDSEKDFLASSSPRKDFLSRPDPAPYAYDDLSVVGTKRNPRSGFNYHSDDEDSILGGLKLKRKDGRGRRSPDFTSKAETTGWSEATAATSTTSNPYLKGITYTDDSTLPPKSSKEGVDMKVKMVEAKFHEEKLRLQQKHDAAVQKILDRKNAEIEDVKVQHRNKMKEMEDHMTKMEKKIQNLLKESQQMQDTKDRQIAEMKNLVEETNTTKRQEFEKKINDIVSEFEQEKFDMQKQHTKNIQEILDDTNARLQKMEREYSQQTTSTQNVIKELEARVQQLMNETENIKKSRAQLEKEKTEADSRIERFKSELRTQQDKMLSMEQDHQRSLEQHDQDLRGLQRKTESNIDFLKQEHNMAQTKGRYFKAAETVSELESHIDQLKRNLKDAEEQRQRQIRELEQVHKQDKFHMDTLHEKQLSSAKKEIDQLDADLHKKIKNLEQIVRDREDEIKRLSEKNRHQAEESEKALSAFKEQVDKNQTRMFDDMKQQMARVESDLNKSKLAREKQAKEFNRQIDEEKANHNREVMELKMSFEQEKATMLKDFHLQKEFIHGEHEKETENLKSLHKQEVTDLERRMHLRQEKDAKKIASLDLREQELREEVVQSNQLRKQQLVELGLLREEEKQTMQREQETEMNKLRSEMEQQRLELQKTHSTEMEHVLGKTNDRLKQIEREYSERAQKSADTISELHATINQLRGDMKKQRESSDNKLSELVSKYDEEKKILKKHYNSNLSTVQKELESKYTKIRQLERQLDQQETDQDEKITHLKMSFEEKMRGLMPSSIRTELENTIESLKSQISSLQQKCTLLQEELDMQSKFPLGTFSTRTSSPIKSSS
ncbi:centrosomal protein of 112 kDa-like isoform X3 [Mercenaria mercenaria]|uniref:centrosomal protein of 112 kDa-like isoform X3 n=1 Tax=Mercenaria mercenaria TaxID=6596 RepID=UPI00234F2DAC|nr:centrosomal protein of 112 kDa-like isoform X3 [Mercenaria mercenaria]